MASPDPTPPKSLVDQLRRTYPPPQTPEEEVRFAELLERLRRKLVEQYRQ